MPASNNIQALQQGSYGAGGEVLDFTYYDTMSCLSTTLVNHLFTQAIGQGSSPKTLDQTNMINGGSMPQGQNFQVNALKVMISGPTTILPSASILKLYKTLANTTVELLMSGKDNMGIFTLQELLGACTLIGQQPTVSGDNLPFILPKFHGIFPLNVPWTLAALAQFELRITHQAAPDSSLDGLLIKIGLNGRLTRLS